MGYRKNCSPISGLPKRSLIKSAAYVMFQILYNTSESQKPGSTAHIGTHSCFLRAFFQVFQMCGGPLGPSGGCHPFALSDTIVPGARVSDTSRQIQIAGSLRLNSCRSTDIRTGAKKDTCYICESAGFHDCILRVHCYYYTTIPGGHML